MPFSTLHRSPTHLLRTLLCTNPDQGHCSRSVSPLIPVLLPPAPAVISNMPNHKHLTPLTNPSDMSASPPSTMISVAFRWLLSPASHKRQCYPSHSILIDILSCKVLLCPNASSQVPDRPVPALFAFNSLCTYAFKLVGLSGDPIFSFPHAYVVYDSVIYTCPWLVQ